MKEYLEIVKFYIEKGVDVNSHWFGHMLENRMCVFTLINNFNDPFYHRDMDQDELVMPQINILIENGMI